MEPPAALLYWRPALQIAGQTYAISHRAGDDETAPPVHIVALETPLDRRGENRRSPHALVQEFLNSSDALWGIVTDGCRLRLLRDSKITSRPTYLEFDLSAMVEGNLYSEFVLLFRLLHRTRLPHTGADAGTCLLETYFQGGLDEGGRARDRLRDGVKKALEEIGTAFLAHPKSGDLRGAISSGRLDILSYYRQLLRLVYRLLFLFVVEERKLLFVPTAENAGRQGLYGEYYSMARLRSRCETRFADDGFSDLWEGLKQTFLLFREEDAAKNLGLSALDSELFGGGACPDLENARCENRRLLAAVWYLSVFLDEKKVRRRVNYAGLDVEELGSVYESLLDFHPLVQLEPSPRFDLVTGSERKQTGSYYTPPSLVRELIESALVPVMEERLKSASTPQDKEAALLALRVCDPASGSGHFLLAAARRIARELAKVRSGEEEPAPETFREALRDVVRSCIYAVDKNPLAVDLCKVALWIEGYNAGMPLSFLDNHIKLGDSLVGVADLDVMAEGIPDEAYTPVSGDDKAWAALLKKRNKQERGGQLGLWSGSDIDLSALAQRFRELGLAEERSPYEVHAKEVAYERLRHEADWWDRKIACDLWTAAYFFPLRRGDDPAYEVPTTDTVRGYLSHPGSTNPQLVARAQALSITHPFFHWPLEFPDVFSRGGFDVVLGNPPWERIKLQEQEFFAARDPDIAKAANKAARTQLIKTLPERLPQLNDEFQRAVHASEATSKFIRASTRFPFCGRGDVNTYSIFAELNRSLLQPSGRVGCIVPSGIATDDTTKFFFADLMEKRALASLFDLENRENIFPGVGHGRFKFCLLTMTGDHGANTGAEFAFFLTNTGQLTDDERRFILTMDDTALLNPNTHTCPIFRSRRDAELTKAIYRHVPVLIKEGPPEENPWGLSFQRMCDMSNDSNLFRTHAELKGEGWQLQGNTLVKGGSRYVPLYEAKFVWHFDHRLGSYGEFEDRPENTHLPPTTAEHHNDPNYLVIPWYWVPDTEVAARLQGRWEHPWLLGWRDITNTTNERTVIAGLLPRVACGDTLLLMFPTVADMSMAACLAACLDSYALDYAARQKIGGTHLKYHVFKQLPVLPPSTYDEPAPWSLHETVAAWIAPRVLELVYSAWDMQPFARDMGYDGPPFPWDEVRRFHLRCELDAAFFHLYGIERHDVDYIMDTFPIVKRKDEAKWGEYRTKRVILEMYDAMARAATTGIVYGGIDFLAAPARASV